ncbi:uncharacterized protein LOC121784332 [Salvia splendens]|uniref:uncharacterized protein LOC121784332 n=1 Tax=Salvia splendens TaxID=180675 RepID=UPI001C26278F|nr:uncharacterized protein LOC121784332 [Salvia splendens]
MGKREGNLPVVRAVLLGDEEAVTAANCSGYGRRLRRRELELGIEGMVVVNLGKNGGGRERQKPPQFDGLGEPSKAETWIRTIERIFDFMECTDKERLACVTFQLTGPTDFWWDTKLRTMNPERREALTWEIFKEEVYNKYVPMSYRRAKVVEFHTLKQGNMTVTEYDRALCEITRYAPELVDTDEKMAEKFRAGLKHEIRVAVASRRGLSYSEILACALDVEEALPKEMTVANTTPVPLQQHNF